MRIGLRIKQCRKLKGLTQEDLAKASGISLMSIRRYESGERLASEKVLRCIANALGISFSDLVKPKDILGMLVDGTDDIDSDHEFTHAWDYWLTFNNINFMSWRLNDTPGLLITFTDSNESFFLTSEQAEQLPKDSIAAVKDIIRAMGKNNASMPTEPQEGK